MAHFAKIENEIVTTVIVAEQDFIDAHCEGTWVQTSYNTSKGVHYGQDGTPDGGTALRKNYAGVGFTYDSGRDAFYEPKPYPSWTLEESTCVWVCPIALPGDLKDDKRYTWNEENQTWDESDL